jgi:hypothetical protein
LAQQTARVGDQSANQSGPRPVQISVADRGWPKLLAQWKLAGDCRDAIGGHHGEPRRISFVNGRDGGRQGAASFDGIDSLIRVADHPDFHFGVRDFSIAFWINLAADLSTVIGDVLSKYDAAHRRGITLSITGSSPGYSGVGDARNVQFGIDNGINGSWIDCGRPWKTNPTVGTLTVYQGQLYTGISDASTPQDACHVFRYAGGTEWIDCGRLGQDPRTVTAYSMIVHQGKLYAGTGIWDSVKARGGQGGPNHVYVYEGGKQWGDCGEFSKSVRTTSLASFQGALYAGDDFCRCYRYEGDRKWAYCGELGDWKVERMFNTTTVFRGHLYVGAHPAVYRYKGGTKWESLGRQPHGATQVHKIQVYDGHLVAGTWPHGKVLRYEGDQRWTDCGQLGIATDQYQINEINELTVYNGKLYAGVLPRGEVYRYEGGKEWTLLRTLVAGPDWSPRKVESWFRVTCMTIFQGKLFIGTALQRGSYVPGLPPETGRVYSMEAGKSVSYDDDLGPGWKHVVAIREKGRLKLYVSGRLVAQSAGFDNADYDLSNSNPLLIGFGAQNYFSGALSDLRLYGGALSPEQVRDLHSGSA